MTTVILGALDTAYTSLLTDLTSFFGDIKTLVISVVSFGIIISFLKLAKHH